MSGHGIIGLKANAAGQSQVTSVQLLSGRGGNGRWADWHHRTHKTGIAEKAWPGNRKIGRAGIMPAKYYPVADIHVCPHGNCTDINPQLTNRTAHHKIVPHFGTGVDSMIGTVAALLELEVDLLFLHGSSPRNPYARLDDRLNPDFPDSRGFTSCDGRDAALTASPSASSGRNPNHPESSGISLRR